MTYNELNDLVAHMRVDRSSWRNRERLARHGLRDGMIWQFKGCNHKRYNVGVCAARGYIGLQSKHRLSTLKRWCADSVGHVVELGN